MPFPTFDLFVAIEEHSRGFADAAEGHLDAPVEHCPAWAVSDLVQHLTTVHWFWATIVEEQLDSPPDDSRRPAPAPRAELLTTFRSGADRLVSVLRAAEPGTPVYTWAPSQHDIAFVIRHQVQEAAVHHWDAAHAAGRDVRVEAPVAVDAIDEFLTFSVSSDADPAEPARPALGGRFALSCSDVEPAWTISDGATPGTVAFERGSRPDTPAIASTASDLLLWLYGRVALDTGSVPDELTERFRRLCFTN